MNIDTQIWLAEKLPWIIGITLGIILTNRHKKKRK